MHTTVFSGAILGVEGLTVEVEVDIARGIPVFSIVGLPNTAVRESRERVTAAIKNTGLEFPLQRITVNLAPADIKKEGAAFDLAIATGIVLASAKNSPRAGAWPDDGRDNASVEESATASARTIFLGELTLSGEIRRVRGVLPILLHAKREGFTRAVIPYDNYAESVYVSGIEVFACRRLRDALGLLSENAACGEGFVDAAGDAILHKSSGYVERAAAPDGDDPAGRFGDMHDVIGQEAAKRALLVAAAGGHHVLMTGPPGAGKTMLARRFCSLLPALDEQAALEATMIYSTAGLLDGVGLVTRSPFRAPHHSASDAGLIGGGNVPRPGEVTLAHNGVLFLDELPEFKRHVLETLREPLEEGRITISRAKSAVTFPARFQLVAAMNPCPCGQSGAAEGMCRCGPQAVERYLGRISGPLLDRIAIHVFVRPVELSAFSSEGSSRETSAQMRARVTEARERQRLRAAGGGAGGALGFLNARLPEGLVKKVCRLDDAGNDLLIRAQKQLRVSARGRGHLLRVARTIADLEGSDGIRATHVAEAVQYRMREVRAESA